MSNKSIDDLRSPDELCALAGEIKLKDNEDGTATLVAEFTGHPGAVTVLGGMFREGVDFFAKQSGGRLSHIDKLNHPEDVPTDIFERLPQEVAALTATASAEHNRSKMN